MFQGFQLNTGTCQPARWPATAVQKRSPTLYSIAFCENPGYRRARHVLPLQHTPVNKYLLRNAQMREPDAGKKLREIPR